MSTALPTIDLDRMVSPIANVTIRTKSYPVLPVGGAGYEMLKTARAVVDPSEYLRIAREVVAKCVPDCDVDLINDLTVDQLTAVIGIVTGRVDEVRKMIETYEGNVASPKGRTARKSRRPRG